MFSWLACIMLYNFLIITSKGATAPWRVTNLASTVATVGYGPRLLTTSAGGPQGDLRIQFFTVDSGNLFWASLTSCSHCTKVDPFSGIGTVPLKVGIFKASPLGLAANLWVSSIILMNLTSWVSAPGWDSLSSLYSSFSLACSTSSGVALLHVTSTFCPSQCCKAVIRTIVLSRLVLVLNSITTSVLVIMKMLVGGSEPSTAIPWVINIPAITSLANRAGARGSPNSPCT